MPASEPTISLALIAALVAAVLAMPLAALTLRGRVRIVPPLLAQQLEARWTAALAQSVLGRYFAKLIIITIALFIAIVLGLDVLTALGFAIGAFGAALFAYVCVPLLARLAVNTRVGDDGAIFRYRIRGGLGVTLLAGGAGILVCAGWYLLLGLQTPSQQAVPVMALLGVALGVSLVAVFTRHLPEPLPPVRSARL